MAIRVKYIDGTYEDFENANSWEFDDFVDILDKDENIIANINSEQARSIIDLNLNKKRVQIK